MTDQILDNYQSLCYSQIIGKDNNYIICKIRAKKQGLGNRKQEEGIFNKDRDD